MKDNNSHNIPFKDLPKKAVNGTVVFNNVFYTITAVNSVEFVARRGKDVFTNLTKHLHPYGKTGTIDKFGKDVPFFIFKKDKPRKDTPKEQIEGTPYNEVVTTSVESIRKANLTNHIVQIGDSKEGGFVTADNGTEVIVKLKNGLLRRINKSYLHYQKVWYTKKRYKRLWFKYISNQELPYNEPKLQTKGNPFQEYKELLSRFDKDYIMTDDPRVRKYQEQIHDRMKVLWDKLTPKQKERVS